MIDTIQNQIKKDQFTYKVTNSLFSMSGIEPESTNYNSFTSLNGPIKVWDQEQY